MSYLRVLAVISSGFSDSIRAAAAFEKSIIEINTIIATLKIKHDKD